MLLKEYLKKITIILILSTDYRSFVGFLGSMEPLMGSILLLILPVNYVMLQRHIQMMKL